MAGYGLSGHSGGLGDKCALFNRRRSSLSDVGRQDLEHHGIADRRGHHGSGVGCSSEGDGRDHGVPYAENAALASSSSSVSWSASSTASIVARVVAVFGRVLPLAAGASSGGRESRAFQTRVWLRAARAWLIAAVHRDGQHGFSRPCAPAHRPIRLMRLCWYASRQQRRRKNGHHRDKNAPL